ncbi:hypothetical protein BBF96_08425 [Anoxybacter fermentans]|uniref:MurNAc-LAA domain-containing protein n=1 Tax=Anoxybacter fermentans TaxID=1323375 RepID=A0A3S9SYQ6_9FIRM|nr:N-acetylmuramoyl-L-alanine amidase family protein [Anoxybacter fermentans]AZR73405.1 hypothetical protein BBF96_08425 [Anoxybacter fermentans]
MGRGKIFYNIFLVIILVLVWGSVATAADKMTLNIQGNIYNNVPFKVEDGELMVPVRIIVKELDGVLEWYELLKILKIRFDEYEIKMQVDNPKVQINPGGQIVQLPVPPRIVKGQVMVPLRFFTQYFGFFFKWDEKRKFAQIYKPSNWVLDLIFEEGISGERLVINSTKEVPYSTMVLENPDRLVIDLKQSALSARATDILWETYVFKSVRIRQFDEETVRVVVELNHKVQYRILKEKGPDGFKVIVAFVPGIRQIALTDKGISIRSSGEIGDYKVLELSKPDRLVIDLTDQTLQLVENKIKLDHPLIKQIRASQHSWDPKIVRIVLDLNERIGYNILRSEEANEIIVQTKSLNSGPIISSGSQLSKPFAAGQSNEKEKKTTTAEFILEDVKEGYGERELVGIEILEGLNQRVVLRTSTPVNYKVWYLPDPDRLVVDLEGAITRLDSEQIPAKQGNIKRVRMHQYPDKVRVVFDLNRYVNHNVLSTKQTQRIEISLGKNPLEGKIIVIDPGHGGSDPGAVGPGGLFEKDVTLDIGLKVRKLLRDSGATVIMTRDKDVYPTLGERVDLANQLNADIFVSIHCNSFVGIDPGGTETFISPTNKSGSLKLANAIQNNLVKTINLFDRGVKSDEFYVLNHTTMPAVLVEVAFISKKEEATLLADPEFRKKAALGIYEGVMAYFAQIMESGESQ